MIEELERGALLKRALVARTPVGRLEEPEEIAAAIAFLASGKLDFLNGATFVVNGGCTFDGDYTGRGLMRRLTGEA